MVAYKHDAVVPYKESGLPKKQQVADMFDHIAFRYDLLNRFLSGGTDLYWRRRAIRELMEINPQTILDVATGTADMPIMMAKSLHPKKITGIDISGGMLAIGSRKIAKLKLDGLVELEKGDSESMRFAPDLFDAVTVAFGVRNFEHLEKGLQEIKRVLKPGGKLVVLEFSQPKNRLFKKLCDLYFRIVAPGIGKLVSKDKEAYRYLDKSVKSFPEGADFIHILQKTGYTGSYYKTLSFGICTIYCCTKQKQ